MPKLIITDAVRQALPWTITRQPLWGIGGWVAMLDNEHIARDACPRHLPRDRTRRAADPRNPGLADWAVLTPTRPDGAPNTPICTPSLAMLGSFESAPNKADIAR